MPHPNLTVVKALVETYLKTRQEQNRLKQEKKDICQRIVNAAQNAKSTKDWVDTAIFLDKLQTEEYNSENGIFNTALHLIPGSGYFSDGKQILFQLIRAAKSYVLSEIRNETDFAQLIAIPEEKKNDVDQQNLYKALTDQINYHEVFFTDFINPIDKQNPECKDNNFVDFVTNINTRPTPNADKLITPKVGIEQPLIPLVVPNDKAVNEKPTEKEAISTTTTTTTMEVPIKEKEQPNDTQIQPTQENIVPLVQKKEDTKDTTPIQPLTPTPERAYKDSLKINPANDDSPVVEIKKKKKKSRHDDSNTISTSTFSIYAKNDEAEKKRYHKSKTPRVSNNEDNNDNQQSTVIPESTENNHLRYRPKKNQ